MIQDLQLTVPAPGHWIDLVLASPFTFYRVARAAGVVSLQFDGSPVIQRVAGERGWRHKEPIGKIRVTSTQAETITLSLGGEGDEEAGPEALPHGVTTQGQYPNYTPAPVSPSTARFVTAGMIVPAGPGLGSSQPLGPAQTDGVTQLGVGFGDQLGGVTPSILTPGSGLGSSTNGRAGLSFRVDFASSGDLLLVKASPSSSLSGLLVWDDLGNCYPDGILWREGVYYANVAARVGVSFEAAASNSGDVTLSDRVVSTLSPPPPSGYHRNLHASEHLGVTLPLVVGANWNSWIVRDSHYRRIAGRLHLDIGAGSTYSFGIQPCTLDGSPLTGAIGPIITGISAGGRQVMFSAGPEGPSFGYWDSFGTGSGGFATRVPIDAPAFRLNLTRTAGSNDATLTELDLYLRGAS